MCKLQEIISATGFKHPNGIIHLHVGGSATHGAQTGSQDLDLLGVYIPPVDQALGITEFETNPDDSKFKKRVEVDHFDWSTAPDNRKNTKDDVDVSLSSLRKWAGLAAKGHPEALHCLFTPNLAIAPGMWEKHIRPHADLFISKWAFNTFHGCATEQWNRLRRDRKVQTDPINSKMAMHVVRVLAEGVELLTTGKITFPNQEKDLLLQIRNGEFSFTAMDQMVDHYIKELIRAKNDSSLTEDVDRGAISRLVADTYLDFYTGGTWLRT